MILDSQMVPVKQRNIQTASMSILCKNALPHNVEK